MEIRWMAGWAVALVGLLAGCGGGSSGAGGTGSDSAPVAASVDLASSDGVGGVGGGDGVGDGSAGDGELIRLAVDFTNLRGTWTVTASAYGITGQTGGFSLVKDTANGGYRFVGGRTPQENLRVSNDGHVTGSLPLVIGGTERASRFVVPLKTLASPVLASLAGRYNIAYVEQDPGDVNVTRTGTFATTAATMQVASNGSFTVCPFADYSDGCAGRVTGSFALSPNPKVLDVTWNGAIDGKAEVTAGKSIDSLVWDFQTRNSAGTVVRTGARFAARSRSALVNADYYGSWDLIGKKGATGGGSTVYRTPWVSNASGPFVYPSTPIFSTQTAITAGQYYTATAAIRPFGASNSLPVVTYATTRKGYAGYGTGLSGHSCDAIFTYTGGAATGNVTGAYGSIATTLAATSTSRSYTSSFSVTSVISTQETVVGQSDVYAYLTIPLSDNFMVFVQAAPLRVITPGALTLRQTLSGPAAAPSCSANTCYREERTVFDASTVQFEYALLRRTKADRVAELCPGNF